LPRLITLLNGSTRNRHVVTAIKVVRVSGTERIVNTIPTFIMPGRFFEIRTSLPTIRHGEGIILEVETSGATSQTVGVGAVVKVNKTGQLKIQFIGEPVFEERPQPGSPTGV
jgi:hypothetical protein